MRIVIGGLATDYWVLNTVRDAIHNGYETCLLENSVRALNIQPDNGCSAEEEMRRYGARLMNFAQLSP